MQRITSLELSAESEVNLAQADEILKNNAVVVYLNHQSFKDLFVAVSLALSKLDNAKYFLGPARIKYLDPRKNLITAGFLRSLKLLNIHVIGVATDKDKKSYSKRQQQIMLDKLKRESEKYLNKAGSVYGIFPEGKRNKKNAELMKSKKGIGYINKYDPKGNLYYIPLAILYKKTTNEPKLVVGKPLKLKDIISNKDSLPSDPKKRAQVIADILMNRLAELMPEEFRGYYRKEN